MSESENELEREQVSVPPHHEYRFTVSPEKKFFLRLVEGTAEIFGTELASGREYEFCGQRAAVYTYHGCKLEVEGDVESEVGENKAMLRYANIHLALQHQRTQPAESPSILILGPRGSGKTSLAKILISYAVRSGSSPLMVNLDVRNPVFSPPGSITASVCSHILDVEYGFGLPPVNGPAATQHKQPLVYNYGLHNLDSSSAFYERLFSLLSSGISDRKEQDEHMRVSGAIIDTPHELALDERRLQEVIQKFSVTAVLVLGSDNEMLEKVKSNLPDQQVFNIPTSNGAVEIDDALARQYQRQYIQQYFFGTPHLTLSPFTVSVSLSDIVVYRPVEKDEEAGLLTRVEPSAVLQNCLLAVVNADPNDPIDVVQDAETLGYVHIVEADEARQLLKILLPVPGKVPKKVYIMGDYRYVE